MGMDAHVETAPRELGIFPVNIVHTLVHLAFGVWGFLASRTFPMARAYCRAGGVIFLVLAVLGFVAPDGFGVMPLGGADIGLHAVLGIALAIAGFTARPPVALHADPVERPADRTA
jgi:hypothetical protein